MKKDEILHMVGQSCRPDQEEKLKRWYEDVHIPDLMKFPGITGANRCELIIPNTPQFDYGEKNYPKYLNIYEFKSQEAFEEYMGSWIKKTSIGKDVQSTWNNDPIERIWRVQYKVVRTFEK